MSLEIDLSQRETKNLSALKRVIPSLIEIIERIPHVAVYKFDPKETKWVRFNVEGSGFVVRCEGTPLYQFVILNKEAPEEFILDLATINKFKLQPPYLMLRYSTGQAPVILGLWFHDDEYREKLMQCLSSAMSEMNLLSNSMERVTGEPILKHSHHATDKSTSFQSNNILTDGDISLKLLNHLNTVSQPSTSVKKETRKTKIKTNVEDEISVTSSRSRETIESKKNNPLSSVSLLKKALSITSTPSSSHLQPGNIKIITKNEDSTKKSKPPESTKTYSKSVTYASVTGGSLSRDNNSKSSTRDESKKLELLLNQGAKSLTETNSLLTQPSIGASKNSGTEKTLITSGSITNNNNSHDKGFDRSVKVEETKLLNMILKSPKHSSASLDSYSASNSNMPQPLQLNSSSVSKDKTSSLTNLLPSKLPSSLLNTQVLLDSLTINKDDTKPSSINDSTSLYNQKLIEPASPVQKSVVTNRDVYNTKQSKPQMEISSEPLSFDLLSPSDLLKLRTKNS